MKELHTFSLVPGHHCNTVISILIYLERWGFRETMVWGWQRHDDLCESAVFYLDTIEEKQMILTEFRTHDPPEASPVVTPSCKLTHQRPEEMRNVSSSGHIQLLPIFVHETSDDCLLLIQWKGKWAY